MKHSLRLNVSQQLILTPQLQQAIRLLQLSTLALQQEIQNQVESNPMLEATSTNEEEEEEEEQLLQNTSNNQDEFTDFQWSHLYTNHKQSNSFSEDTHNTEHLHCTTINLQDYLRWQLDLTPMTDIDKIIASAIIDGIDDDGFLTFTPAELHTNLNCKAYPLDIADIEVVRHRIQHFDPMGCASINLADALMIQLAQLPTETPYLALTKQIIIKNISLLGEHKYRQLMKTYQVDKTALENVLLLVSRLHPKPGAVMGHIKPQYISPDLTIKKTGGSWQVELNESILPHLSINNYYASLINRTSNNADHQFLKTNLQEARWFLKSVQSRQETLLKVARHIVDYQKEFFEFGEEAMKPLILSDVADALNIHESTVSRITTQKFIYTPRGLFELRYFFSSHVPTCIGGECSSTAIRAVIKKLISTENLKNPLSDSKIAKLIGEQGVLIARRTVAKYREKMHIAPSYERKAISY